MAKIYRTNGDVEIIEPKNGTDFQLEELSAIVGGYIECLNFTDGSLLVCNEEGKLMNLPYNEELRTW